MAIHIDEYGILDCAYVVHACLLNPASGETPQEWRIELLLHVGPMAYPCSLDYPSRGLRDTAFEQIGDLIRRAQAQEEMEDETDDL